MRPTVKAQLQLHFCVFLWGFTSILGTLIALPAPALVFWRMLLVVAALLLSPRVWRGLYGLSARLVVAYACIGVVVARRRFDPRELVVGVAAVPGVAMVVGATPSGMSLGGCVGIVSALLVAVFGALNKRFIREADALTITFVELGAGTLVLPLLAWLWPHAGSFIPVPGSRDALLLMILAIGCTLLPFALSLVALRHLTAHASQLIVNLEPVYAILLAILLLGEQRALGLAFYAGVAIILGVAFVHPLIRRLT